MKINKIFIRNNKPREITSLKFKLRRKHSEIMEIIAIIRKFSNKNKIYKLMYKT